MTAAPALSLDAMRARVFPHLPPAEWNRHFLPRHGFGTTAAADFHAELSADLDGLHRRRGTGLAYVAPRGGAKSTWVTLAYTARAAVSGWEPHVIILSDSDDQAALHMASLKAELEGNPRLARGYPESTGPGPEWKADRIRLPNGVLVEAKGRGSKVRGRKNRESRPSLVVLDDVQAVKDVRSAAEREHAWQWFTREVLPAGDERTNYLSVGTALHRECVAVRAMELPGWVGRTFPAVRRWPDRMDLWRGWELLATDLSDDRREATAREFYESNRPAMDAGALTYWPAKWSLHDLMLRRAAVGWAAFDTEYQGVPGVSEYAEFPPEWLSDSIYFRDWPDRIAYTVQAVDPSKGTGSKDADYQAHVRVGLYGGPKGDPMNGHLFVEAEARRESDYVGRMLDLAARWKPDEVIAEANNTMGLLEPAVRSQLAERARAGRPVLLNYLEVVVSSPKLVRIRGLTEYLRRGQVHVRDTTGGRQLVNQLRDVPESVHDDLIDALATAVRRLESLYGVPGG